MIPFSILDLAPIPKGAVAATAFRNSLDLAQHAEGWGYNRYWLAEHHNMTGIGSAATSVVICHIATGTQTIRVGSGGIMLPNHAPLIIAEQFGTLESLFPGRIDLGVGRAPGTDMVTARALRRDLAANADRFPQDVVELRHYFEPVEPDHRVRAVPGAGLRVPIWILGSSLYGAQLAAMLGLPYAFASHFAPQALYQALDVYRDRFEPNDRLERPHAMVGINVFAADTDEEARYIFTSAQQQFTNLHRGTVGPLPPPIDDIDAYWTPIEKSMVEQMLTCSFVGSRETVRRSLQAFLTRTRADEIIAGGQIYDHTARLRSFEVLAEIRDELGQQGRGVAAGA